MERHNPGALFIANKKHLKASIEGGVQLCTSEFIQLFEEAGFNLAFFPVTTTGRIKDRIRIKAGTDVYRTYDPGPYLRDLKKRIEEGNIGYVILNQVNLMRFGYALKNHFRDRLKLIVLSHGNESGDFIHELTREHRNALSHFLGKWKLGNLLYEEARYFSFCVDYLLVVSENELRINQWLGSQKTLYIPRIFQPVKTDRDPLNGRFGFVGTLDHPPNKLGLDMLLGALEKYGFTDRIILVGGPEKIGRGIETRYDFVQYLGALDDADLKEEMKSWSWFLNPVFWYSRGVSTKLAFSLNQYVPVISTEAGNRGYTWEKGEVITINSPEEMARKMIELSQQGPTDEKNTEMIVSSGPTMSGLAEMLNDFLK